MAAQSHIKQFYKTQMLSLSQIRLGITSMSCFQQCRDSIRCVYGRIELIKSTQLPVMLLPASSAWSNLLLVDLSFKPSSANKKIYSLFLPAKSALKVLYLPMLQACLCLVTVSFRYSLSRTYSMYNGILKFIILKS